MEKRQGGNVFVIWVLLHGFQTPLSPPSSCLSSRLRRHCAGAGAEPFSIVGFGDSLMAGYRPRPRRGLSRQAAGRAARQGSRCRRSPMPAFPATPPAAACRGSTGRCPDGTAARHPRTRRQRHAARRLARHHREEPRRDARAAEGSATSPVLLAGMRAAPNLGRRLPDGLRRDLSATLPKNTASRSIRSSSTASPADRTCCSRTACTRTPHGVDRMVERILPTVEKAIAAVQGGS